MAFRHSHYAMLAMGLLRKHRDRNGSKAEGGDRSDGEFD